jgi:hypothetical protein
MRGIKGMIWETSVLDPEEVSSLYFYPRVFVSAEKLFLNAKSCFPLLKVEKNLYLKVFFGCL